MRSKARFHAAWLSLAFAAAPAAAQTAFRASTGLNVRTGPGVAYSILGQIPSGSVYCALETSSSWRKIQFDARTGWVNGNYGAIVGGQIGVKVTSPALNVRGGPGTSHPILGVVNAGQVFRWNAALSTPGGPTPLLSGGPASTTAGGSTSLTAGWYPVDWGGRVGWLSAVYLARVWLSGPAAPTQVILNVPVISQLPELPTGCEITAVAMMLQYKGAAVTKTALADEMPRSTNPAYGYVGNPYSKSGWTIYPTALMDLVKKYAGTSINLTGSPVSTLEKQIQCNIPVVVWVVMHGFSVHAITVTGYDPDSLYYNDPWTGQKNAKMLKTAFDILWVKQSRRAISY